jgi:hypothetical protein
MVFLSAPLLQIDIGKLLGGEKPRHLATKCFFPKLFLVLSQFGSWDKAQCECLRIGTRSAGGSRDKVSAEVLHCLTELQSIALSLARKASASIASLTKSISSEPAR